MTDNGSNGDNEVVEYALVLVLAGVIVVVILAKRYGWAF